MPVEAEGLRSGLAYIENSHSWRITAPLRGARRIAARLVSFPVRTAKTMARSTALWSMRRSLAVPFLRDRLPGMLDAHPVLKRRFRNLALNSGLIQNEVEANPATLLPPRAGSPRHASHAALSPRASKVLADLRRAIQERHG